MIHQMNIRIYYQDTDAGGIVYHSKYLDFAERARSELLVDMGFSNMALVNKGVAFVLRNATLNYKKPARLDDVLTVETKVLEMKNASMIMEQKFLRDTEELVTVTLQLAVVDPQKLVPIRLPADLKDLFMKYGQ